MTFKARIVFETGSAKTPWLHDISHPTDAEEVRRAMQLRHAIGILSLIECVRTDMHRNGQWHDALAVEGLPTEFEIQPRTPLLKTENHVIFDMHGNGMSGG